MRAYTSEKFAKRGPSQADFEAWRIMDEAAKQGQQMYVLARIYHPAHKPPKRRWEQLMRVRFGKVNATPFKCITEHVHLARTTYIREIWCALAPRTSA